MDERTCGFCGAKATTDEAVDKGWAPTYWCGGKEVFKPVCDTCIRVGAVIFNTEHGDYEQREDTTPIVIGDMILTFPRLIIIEEKDNSNQFPWLLNVFDPRGEIRKTSQ